MTTTFSHELVEFCTDPSGDGWQMSPRDADNWNEIGDVCSSTSVLNGVTVQSYYSVRDGACVVPTAAVAPRLPDGEHEISRIIEGPYRNYLFAVGGSLADGTQWYMRESDAIGRVTVGELKLFVKGASGERADIAALVSPKGHGFLQTATDGVLEDNLLQLPSLSLATATRFV